MNTRAASMMTLVLTVLCGLFALLAILQLFGLGAGYRWLGDSADASNAVLAAGEIDRKPFKLPDEKTYAEIQQRPPFNEDRKPTQFADPAPDKPALPPVPLNITLNGVILTPDVHLVMLTDKSKNLPVMIKEGMPLPGDQGGWTLVTIKPRSAIFNDGNSEVEVDLSSAPSPPPSKAAAAAPAAANANAAANPNPAATPPATAPATANAPPNRAPQNRSSTAPGDPKADDLQHRIEERRRQMREEAAKQQQQGSH